MGILQIQEKYHEYDGALVSPLNEAKFSKRTLLGLAAFALTGSVSVTLFLAYVLPVL